MRSTGVIILAALCGLGCSQSAKPAKWEYKQVSKLQLAPGAGAFDYKDYSLEPELSKLGDEGWELVNVTGFVQKRGGPDQESIWLVATLKRQKQ